MKYMINRAFGLRGVLTLLALMLAFAASAQNKITGKVVDENDQPAIGANVVVKGTTPGRFDRPERYVRDSGQDGRRAGFLLPGL